MLAARQGGRPTRRQASEPGTEAVRGRALGGREGGGVAISFITNNKHIR